jgi:signal transduction histidine kinase
MRARTALRKEPLEQPVPLPTSLQPQRRWQVARGGMRALQEMSRLSAARLDPAELCQQVLLLLTELYGYDLLSIYFYAPIDEAPTIKLLPGAVQSSEPIFGLRLVAQIGYRSVLERIPVTSGVAGRVARSHKTEYVRHAQRDPDFLAAIPDIRSEICVPLMTPDLQIAPPSQHTQKTCEVYRGPHTDILTRRPEVGTPGEQGGRFLGILNVESCQRTLAPSDVRLMEAIASQLAIAIENARLQQQAGERDAIAAIAERVNAPFMLDEVLQEALGQITETLGVPIGSIHLLEHEAGGTSHMRLCAVRGVPLDVMKAGHLDVFQVTAGESPIYSILATGGALLVNDLQTAPIPQAATREHLLNLGIRALVCLPLEKHGQCGGQLTIASPEPGYFNSERVNFLRIISRQISAAIQKANLLADLRVAYERQREVDRLKDEFMLTASHELRTPLTTVQGYLSLLSDFGEKLSPDQRSQFLENARLAGEQLTLLVNSITHAVQLDAQTQQIQPQAIHLSCTIKTVISLLEPQLHQEKRALSLEVDPTLWVQADEVRLREVLVNLLTNALKYSPPGTPIAVRAAREPSGEAGVQIIDHGPGLSPAEQIKLFQRFARLERELNSQERGSGLGLYISRRLIEAMHGRIWVESSGIPGEGANFRFTLPVTAAPASEL